VEKTLSCTRAGVCLRQFNYGAKTAKLLFSLGLGSVTALKRRLISLAGAKKYLFDYQQRLIKKLKPCQDAFSKDRSDRAVKHL
jgi:hypothetical protein